MLGARIRLASLWLSQVARVWADGCLFAAAFPAWLRSEGSTDGAFLVGAAIFLAPFVLLAPLNGYINNALPRRWVLVGAAAFTLLVVALFAFGHWPWTVCLGMVALGSALYSPALNALLPAAAEDARLPLPRISGWVEMGGAAALAGGLILGRAVDPDSGTSLAGHVISVLLGLNGLSLATAFLTSFPSDLRRPEPPLHALAGFFRDCLRISRERTVLGTLLGLAYFQALVIVGGAARIADCRWTVGEGRTFFFITNHPSAICIFFLGMSLGCVTAAWQAHPRRSLGLVPLGAAGMLLTFTLHSVVGASVWLLVLGFVGGLIQVPLRAAYQAAVPPDARGHGMAFMNGTVYALTILLGFGVFRWLGGWLLGIDLTTSLRILTALAAIGAVIAWRQLYPQAVEQIVEILLTPMYRVRAHGPGTDQIPSTGPLLIVANHAAYLDPFWLCKIIPRKVTPMMTSVFYDLPFIRWSMVHIVGAIRVPEARFRRETPELREAVAVLRQGGCVLIFPEAQLRRREDQPLRMFGQGVWRILQEVPQTPVVVCWIEGGWGSFTSYFNGPPLRGKWPDWRRRIDIALETPRVLDPCLLADQHATRHYLMRTCLECRRYLESNESLTRSADDGLRKPFAGAPG